MKLIQRIALFTTAVACLVAAVLVVINAGIPERAEFTGVIIPGERPVAPEIDAVAPPFDALTSAGNPIDLLDLRGHPIIINFWATWCEPCRVETPDLQSIYVRYADQGLRLIAVNLGENPSQIKNWASNFGLTFDLLLDPEGRIATLYQLRGQPTTYIVDPSGIITHIFYGPSDRGTLEAAIAPFFPG